DRQAINPDDRAIVRDGKSGQLELLQQPNGHGVVAANDGIRHRVSREQLVRNDSSHLYFGVPVGLKGENVGLDTDDSRLALVAARSSRGSTFDRPVDHDDTMPTLRAKML